MIVPVFHLADGIVNTRVVVNMRYFRTVYPPGALVIPEIIDIVDIRGPNGGSRSIEYNRFAYNGGVFV